MDIELTVSTDTFNRMVELDGQPPEYIIVSIDDTLAFGEVIGPNGSYNIIDEFETF